jgi:hypothetical protein
VQHARLQILLAAAAHHTSICVSNAPLFDCLAPPAGPAWLQAADLLEAAAHRIVRLLVRQGWTLANLDVLPFGVALPLRQVS